MYCALCDNEQNNYFQIESSVAQISKQYCYTIVQNSLISLLYQYSHLRKLAELSLTFVSYCDGSGIINKNASI